jgi:hypothetical protein
MRSSFVVLAIPVLLLAGSAMKARAAVQLVRGGVPTARVVVDTRGSEGSGPDTVRDAAGWLSESIERATGARLPIVDELTDAPAVIIARADAWPEVSRKAGLKPGVHDAYCIVSEGGRVFLLGNSEAGARHAVADLLHRWGFRWFAPSPRWHVVPHVRSLSINVNVCESPALIERRVWYAYGMPGEDLAPLQQNYTRWAHANRLSTDSLMRNGHSYGHIIGRNKQAFAEHPKYYALLPDGKRDTARAVNARKFCTSNPGLIELVAADRLALLEEERRSNPAAYMVSVDPSDGEGTCHCENCQALGTTSDRVFHLANEVARRLREKRPEAWVGLYGYSSHRLPSTIDVEPNVYVQVAMGFNRTQYTLPELVERWSEKVEAVGLREYYGVEAWDWGLPGRMRGGHVDYHAEWIPYYAARKVNAVNAETNANWGGQSLGLYVASGLMWNPRADAGALVDEFLTLCFADVAEPMRAFYAKLDSAPPLRPAALLPLFEALDAASRKTQHPEVQARLVDLMAYLVYVAEFRRFDLARSRQSERGNEYYAALRPLMEYAWRIRHRDVVHYYALARRLCNGLPVKDGRPEFYMFNKDQPPVWQTGEPLSDTEVRERFGQTIEALRADDDPTVAYSRLLEHVTPEGEDAGASRILSRSEEAVAQFRGTLTGWLVPRGPGRIIFGITPTARRVELTVFRSDDEVLYRQEFRPRDPAGGEKPSPYEVAVELPKAGEYRVRIEGDCELHVPPSAPFAFEASVTHPAWVSYSGPHYFYVPKGTKELIVDASPRLSLQVPGRQQRLDVLPSDRPEGKRYAVVKVPAGADGRVWHTTGMTRGQVSLLNVPPLLSFHRGTVLVPREVAESDRLVTKP